MTEPRLRIHQFRTSSYCRKVRVVCDLKELPYETVEVGMVRRGPVVKRSGQRLCPVLEDGPTVVHDSTRIARYLDRRFPERPLVPDEPAARARVLVWDDWADEALARALVPIRYLVPGNRRRVVAEMRHVWPPGALRDVEFALLGPAMAWRVRRTSGLGDPAPAFAVLDGYLELLSDALARSGFLAGVSPTLADAAVYAALTMIAGLDGWDRVVHAGPVIRWWVEMSKYDRQPPFRPPDGRGAFADDAWTGAASAERGSSG